MKVKTADLIGLPLDWAVAKCLEVTKIQLYEYNGRGFLRVHLDGGIHAPWEPSHYWAQGGPIIEREWIELQNGSNLHPYLWGACKWSDTDAGTPLWEGKGPTPLIAAMRCVVASRLGDEVDVPDEPV